ncbi:MAG: TolC family protein [Candidatus Longimicrobiales bacterium M2_2A_002]
MRYWRHWSGLVVALAATLSAAPVAAQTAAPGGAPADTTSTVAGTGELTLTEVYELVRERNPMLRAASARAEAVETRESSAGLPPDPTLQVGVMNFSLWDFETDMPNSMAPSIQAMQRVPFPGKLGLSERIAEQSTAMARTGADERWWEVRVMAARAFFGIYEVDRKLQVMRETLGLLKDFQEVARSMYSAGTGRQTDVLRANVEVARMDAEIERMVAMRKVAVARLNAVLNRPAETPVARTVLPALPAQWPDHATLRAWAEETRPMLERSRTGVEQAETRQELARKQIWPDFSIGLQYGQRDAGAMGTARMGSAMIGFSVPIFARSRQLRQRDEAAAMEAMAEAELIAARSQVDAGLGELQAELERARTLLELYRAEVLPQADANVESSFSSYRVGAVDFMTLVDAQMTANRYETEYHALVADYGRAVAELERTVGRELPVTTELMAEAR